LASLSVNQPELALKLLEWPNINVNIKDIFNNTPIYWAVEYGQYEVVRELVKYENLEDTKYALTKAIYLKEKEYEDYKSDIDELARNHKLYENQQRNEYFNNNYENRVNVDRLLMEPPVLGHKWDGIIVLLEQFNKMKNDEKNTQMFRYFGGNRKVVKKRTTRKLRKGRRKPDNSAY